MQILCGTFFHHDNGSKMVSRAKEFCSWVWMYSCCTAEWLDLCCCLSWSAEHVTVLNCVSCRVVFGFVSAHWNLQLSLIHREIPPPQSIIPVTKEARRVWDIAGVSVWLEAHWILILADVKVSFLYIVISVWTKWLKNSIGIYKLFYFLRPTFK